MRRLTTTTPQMGLGSRRAYTFVELTIVVVILGIMATVGVSAVESWGRQMLPVAARRLASDLRLARQLSIEQNTTYEVRFDLTAQSYSIVHTGTATVPLLVDPLAPPGSTATGYVVPMARFQTNSSRQAGVRLSSVRIPAENRAVTNVPFAATGGTGPTRSADTEIVLIHGEGARTTSLTLGVSWLTGQVRVE